MDLMVTRKISSIYITLLVIALFLVMPGMDAHAQSKTDINKPTRERVTNKKDKQETKQEAPAKKQEAAPTKKQEAKPAEKKPEAKPADKQEVKAGDKQSANPENAKPATDTAANPATPPKPKKQPLDTEKVQFDGIDVSKHQGDINWEELKKNTKIKFVFIKATEGSDYIDPRYKQNIKEARRHGFKVGSYHFLTNRSSATSQFINFAKTANRDEQDLIPIIDVEVCKQWSSQQLRDSLKVFADLLEDYYGCKPMIYTSEKFFTKHLGRAFADYPLFIAKYNTAQPNIGYKWIIWQFSDCGLFRKAVKGNNGEVDLSRFNKGCSISDLIYKPVKGKPKISVMDAVDKNKEKPATINLTEQQGKAKEAPKTTAKQKEEEQKKAEKAKRASEREKRLAEEEAKKKAKEKADADKKAKAKAEQQQREKERQQAKDKKAKEEAAAKERKAAEQKAKADAEAKRKAAEKAEADAKAKRKAAAQKAKQEANQKSSTSKQNKSASLLGSSSSKMSKAQQGDSIRNARYQGRKTNKSSADND
ncbi:MAG: hypothetical protein IJK41_01795 [Muribaculaceae bacterium]|nr:hypothetical protein [Muribaculaceae bacterium]